MRILDVQLIAYGPFTGLSLDLSQGDSGLHLVFGPNEAGKSASLRALTACFYGIPARTPDNFIHNHQALRIGARLRHSDSTEIVFQRRKGNKDTLLDPAGKPLPETALARYLGGAGEALFRSMFGIDHESLLRGGEQILKGGGEVGEILFAAGLGGTNLRQVLQSLEEDARSLQRKAKGGSSPSIPDAVTRYKEAKQKSLQAAVSSSEWARHDKALSEAQAAKERIAAELRKLQSDRNRLERFKKALPRIAERRDFREKLEALGAVRLVPESFGKARREAVQKLQTARESEQSALRALTRIDEKIAALVIPEGLLEQSETITDLHEKLGSHRKALKDLQRLKGEAAQVETAAQAVLKELRPEASLEAVEALRINAAKRARIRELGSQHRALDERLTKCSRDIRTLTEKLSSRKERLQGIEPPRDLSGLRALLLTVQKKGELEEQLKTAYAELLAGEAQAKIELDRLGLWSGPLEALEALCVPSAETIDRFDAGLNERQGNLRSLLERMRQAEERRREFDLQIETLQLAGAVPAESDLEAARIRRDAGWALVRRAWLDRNEDLEAIRAFDSHRPLPTAYELSVSEADGVADRLRREADRVAKQAALLAQRNKDVEELEAGGKKRAELEAELEQFRGQWEALWRALGITPLTPAEMRSWKVRQGRLAQAAGMLRTNRSRVEHLRQQIAEHRAALSACLAALGEAAALPDESLEALIHRSQKLIAGVEEAARKQRELHLAIAQIEEDLLALDRDKDHAVEDVARWQREWVSAVAALGLDANASATEANTVLDKLEELFKAVDKLAGLESRIKGILRDAAEFEQEVRRLTERSAPELDKLPAEQAVAELNVRLSKVREDAATLAGLREQRSENEALLHRSRLALEEAGCRLRELCEEVGCTEHGELEELEERSTKAQLLQREIETIERQLIEDGGGLTVEEFVEEAREIDADALPSQIAALAERIEELDRERSELIEAIGREKNQLALMDGRAEAAEAAERGQAILAEIREGANRYIRLRLASAILRREIERYRSENQDPLLRRAGEFFARVTLGSFIGLESDYNESDEPILLGVRPGGEKVPVQGMSEGSRDQLYLVLRLASLERYLTHNEPMPLIVDDILINFDDRRSEATLQLLGELSRKTQIIFFTHHAHLIDLARASLPESLLIVHSLEGRKEG